MIRQLTFLTLACLVTQISMAEGPAKDIPELQALSNYIGTWDVKITSPGTPFSKGESTSEWILDGRFVQQTSSLTSAEGKTVLKMTTLMTYDPKAQTYRMWTFASDGSTNEAVGNWDEKTKTMTSKIRSELNEVTTADFSKEGIESWKMITVTDEATMEMTGINTRRQK